MNRAQLKPEFENLKELMLETFNDLKSKCHQNWYPSLVLERRDQRNISKDDRSQSFSQDIVQGVNLRVFNGVTMYEVATDNLDPDNLSSLVNELIQKLKGAESHIEVKTPQWSDRLKQNLDKEIRCQIPENPSSETWVHFGVPQRKELDFSESSLMKEAISLYSQMKDHADQLEETHLAKKPDYTSSRMGVEVVDFLFIDLETRMTQTLFRNRAVAILMKGADRSYILHGGLGGKETLEISTQQLNTLYDDLELAVKAKPIEPGRYKLLMGPSITGVFAHEAFGHSQEGDTWARGRSQAKKLYESKEIVGNEHATILNNPAIYKNGEDDFAAWGSYYFDEEGWLAEKQYMVKEGVLQEPMTNFTSAYRLNVPRSANGKRESWKNAIYTRQTNTYFSEGEYTYKELIEKVDHGYLGRHAAGGMEDPKGMGIQVGMSYVEEIKDGKLTGNVFKGPNGGDVQLTGYVPDYLKSIIGKTKIEAFNKDKDSAKHPWIEVGGCGKYHKEIVEAGCGGTYVLIDNALLG